MLIVGASEKKRMKADEKNLLVTSSTLDTCVISVSYDRSLFFALFCYLSLIVSLVLPHFSLRSSIEGVGG